MSACQQWLEMSACQQWYYAEDGAGDSLPFTMRFEFYESEDGAWVAAGLYGVGSGSFLRMDLDSTQLYKVVPLDKVIINGVLQTLEGWTIPKASTFFGCAKDITFVYEEIICTPDDLKCVGDNVYKCDSTGTEWRFSESCVAHVVKMPHYGLPGVDPGPDIYYWPEILGYVGGEWLMADPATKYRIEVGSIDETIPAFDKTYSTGSFADGIDCVVMALGDSGVGTLLFKEEDVFRLNKDSPTEIWLSNTSNDIISEAFMGPVCDLFGIARGTACQSFWAELYDPMFLANYACIENTGKDLLGNEREITLFDKIAVPFAILGSLPGLSLLPFGAFVTKGLKTATKFGDAAVRFMLNFTMDAANKISTKDTWYFLDAIGQVTKDHADEIINALEAGDTTLADTLLRKYAGESKGWWDYHALNDMLEDALPTDSYNWLRTQIGLTEIGAGTVTNTAKQATLSADDLAKLADAAKDSGVMDEVAGAVYKSLIDVEGAPAAKVEELANILKNSPETSASVAAKNIPMARFVDSTAKHYDVIKNQLGATKANAWFKNNAVIARKALDSTDPTKMADIPHAAQEYAASYADVATDMGEHIADDIIKATDDFVGTSTSNWITTGRQIVKNTSTKFWNHYESLSAAGKENIVHIMMGAALVFCIVVLYAMYADSGPETLNQNLFTSKMDTWYWPCYYASEDGDADALDEAIKVYEKVINECEESLYDHKDVLEDEGRYDEFYKTLQLHKFNLARMKRDLEKLQPCGNIHCTANTDFFYVDLDGEPAGFSYANYEVLLTAVKTGSHKVRIHKQNYSPECSKDVDVTEGTPKTFNCDMYLAGDCSPITAVAIYTDPLSPVEDETVSFNGSAKSGDTISSWEWDFGDGSPKKSGQAVTRVYSSKGVYKVELKVTNDCGESQSSTRNVTVSEETVVPESTTLQIETPYGTDGKEIPRYWEIEIWVDGKDTACNPPKTLTFGTGVFCDCTSPWNLVECELGTHTITLKKYGYDDKSISVYLEKDKPKTWTKPIMTVATTQAPVHTVYIEVPVGSALYVDGGSVGGTTAVSRLSTIYDGMRK